MSDSIDPRIECGALYRHYEGDIYTLICTGKLTLDCSTHVVYMSLYDKEVCICPIDEFLEILGTGEGTHFARFEKIN